MGKLYLNINEIDAMELKPNDQVKCTYSRVEGRTGQIFTVSKGNPSKKALDNGFRSRPNLSFLASYGDQFQKL